MTCIKIILQFSGYLKSCHPRHQHITDYQISIIRTCTFQSRRTIRLGHNFKILSHFFFQKLTYIVIIFYNKYLRLLSGADGSSTPPSCADISSARTAA